MKLVLIKGVKPIRGFKPFMSQKLNVDKFYDGLQEEIFIRKNIPKELKDKNLKEDSNNFNNIGTQTNDKCILDILELYKIK